MVGAIAHRGPDGRKCWVHEGVGLGHARLAIIDLTAEADQPFMHPESGARLIFNGELYNYRELRAELEQQGHRFTTASDTEVVLQAVLHWGPAALDRMLGMWAFAIVDPGRRELFLSRDRFGIKPLYYAVTPVGLVFGSEIRALLASGFLTPAADPARVAGFLALGEADTDEGTFFAGIRRVPAGTYARVPLDAPGEPQFTPYWDDSALRLLAPAEIGYDQATREFRGLLESAVEFHLRSDVPVGMCLSGGLDSSSLVSLAAGQLSRDGSRPFTFTAGFPGLPFDESAYATAVAERHRLTRVFVHPDEHDFNRDIDRLVENQEEPFGSPGVYLQWRLFEQIRASGIKVVLDGQGADEYLGGYKTFLLPLLVDQLATGRIGAAAGTLLEVVRHKRPPRLSAGYLRAIAGRALGRTRGPASGNSGDWLSEGARAALADRQTAGPDFGAPGISRFRRAMLGYLLRWSLPALLRYEDKNAMAFGVEARVPYLDHRLVLFAASVPDEFLVSGGVTKRLLRDAVRDIVPPVVVNRRDKLGFASPIGPWVAATIVPRLTRLLAEPFASEYVNPAKVGAVARTFMRRPAGRHLDLWRAYSVLAWHDQFLSR